ncbi:AaceriADR255Wp [[Ashbya] aceris (nom. inval.)]|nr:AaceriADR255Wp [[Ashbya] aceris (nom. inval.)]
MGNVPGKLEAEEYGTMNGRRGGSQKQYRSLSQSSTASSGSAAADSGRSRRATSLVGNLLSAGGVSRAESYGGSTYRRRVAREKDRLREQHALRLVVRSDETVDGGYLAPYGSYRLEKLDYDAPVVQSLIVERRLAPFYTPLQDFDPAWTREELVRVVDSLMLHAPFEEELEEFEGVPLGNLGSADIDALVDKTLSRREQRRQRSKIFRARLHRKRILWQEEENSKFLELKLEARRTGVPSACLPSDDAKWDLYQNGAECPICFLYFPEPMNVSRCCLQPICTECFVQIKRQEPHFPHDEVDPAQPDEDKDPNMLISTPASCPFCATPNFGVTYKAPADRVLGIQGAPPNSYVSSVSNPPHHHTEPPPRRKSVAHDHASVVTSDMIRPDWETELIKERTKLARRAANATAIHVSNRLVDPGHTRGYSNSFASASSTYASNSSMTADFEEEMIRHVMRLSLLDQQPNATSISPGPVDR